jgi:hypothetical protein
MKTRTYIKFGMSFFFVLCLLNISKAQNEIEALRYSQMYWGGTARYLGAGGAFGAVGADASAISTNPASMGVYKKSDLNFSPSIHYSKAIVDYNNTSAEDFKYNFNVSNLGVVLSGQIGATNSETPQWKFMQFGFGLNRLANYNNNTVIEGFNDKNSLMTQYRDFANGIKPANLNKFDTWLAYETYLLDPLDTINFLYSSPVENGGVQQRKTINTKGSMNEWYFALSGNYDDKLFIGATLGLPYFNYKESSQYEEEDIHDTINGFKNFTINDNLTTNGSGVNLKVGFIYRPVEMFRFGAAVHTPTFFYRISDTFTRDIKSNVNGIAYDIKSDVLDYKYEINTPLRLMGNMAFTYKNFGFIGLDYEFVDYSSTRLRSSDYNFFTENNNVKAKYQAQHVVRAGGELNLSPMAIRLGYAYYTNPFKSSVNDASRSSISGGVGFRSESAYIDFAYIYSMVKEDYYLYAPAYVNAANQKFSTSNFVATLGVRF